MQNHKIFWFITVIIIIILVVLFAGLNPLKPHLTQDVQNIQDTQNASTTSNTIDVSASSTPKFTYINATPDNIVVDLPYPDAVTGKKFTVIGKARGTWYFEASFPVTLKDKNGKVLVTTHATAQDDWMTENFVPFTAEISVPQTYIGPVTLILDKDNPSGDPERDASLSFSFTVEY